MIRTSVERVYEKDRERCGARDVKSRLLASRSNHKKGRVWSTLKESNVDKDCSREGMRKTEKGVVLWM